MHGGVEIAARRGAGLEALAGEVELRARDATHAVAGVLVLAQTVRGAHGLSLPDDRRAQSIPCG